MKPSHIYIEKRALGYELTERILGRYGGSSVIFIDHYKDVFNRTGQEFSRQERSRSLILAVNDGNKIFPGAPVCQDFGSERFFYSVNAMNCVFNCEYCFLKGMYPGANIVLFVNLDDYEREVDLMLADGPLYLSCSYDTDLLALEEDTGLSSFWTDLALSREGLYIELRTKSAPKSFVPSDRIIYAFSISPREVIQRYEHKTASFHKRIESVIAAQNEGAQGRLCLDPMIFVPGFEEIYGSMTDEIIRRIDLSLVRDISIGSFRISKEYIKQMRRNSGYSSSVMFPFVNEGGYLMYPEDLRNKMTDLISNKLEGHIDGTRIYKA